MDAEEIKDEKYYFLKRRLDRTYFSKQFTHDLPYGKRRFVHKAFETSEEVKFLKMKDEVVLSIGSGGRFQVKAILLEDDRSILKLVIQTFTEKNGNPHKDVFSFQIDEIDRLYNFLKCIKEYPLKTIERIVVDENSSTGYSRLSFEDATKIYELNIETFTELAKNNISTSEIIALRKRKEQLARFDKLLTDDKFFESEKIRLAIGSEGVWQNFFEQNTWVLGYGLNYVFNSPLDGKKLEQVVTGYDFTKRGKRADALLKTRSLISSLSFGEIKTHKAALLRKTKDPYRSDCWAVSDELSGAIAQSQRTIQRSLENIRTRISLADEDGSITGEEMYLYLPKSFLVIGSLSEFKSDHGINESKFSSFEMYRRSLFNPEIVTYDELYERAKFIVNQES